MVKRNSIILLVRNDLIGSCFLTYFDTGWNTWFFPNFTDDGQSEEVLVSQIAKRFESPKDWIRVKFLRDFSEAKPSQEHDGELREYQYKIYFVDIGRRDFERLPVFYWNGLKYKWEDLKSLEEDPQVEKNNRGLLEVVEELEKQREEGEND